MAPAQPKGDILTHGSTFIKHLLNYPVFKDGAQKADKYGQKSIQLGNSAYKTFAAHVLPWFAKPIEYVSPYVQKADELGDKTLNRIDERFPIVKKPTCELYNETKGLILLPYTKGLEGKDHVLQVYSTEYNKNEQTDDQAGRVAHLVAYGKAVFTTVLLVSNETLSWLSSFVSAKKAEATQKVNDKINQ